jgi:hypothetical protein
MTSTAGRTNRRAILRSILAAGAGVAVTSSSAGASSTPNARADSTLIALGADLVACDALKELCPDDDDAQDAALYEQHWDLREKINRIPATTLDGIRVKARAAEFAFKGDNTHEMEGEGSFVELCRSLNADILSMAAAS